MNQQESNHCPANRQTEAYAYRYHGGQIVSVIGASPEETQYRRVGTFGPHQWILLGRTNFMCQFCRKLEPAGV